MTTNVADMNGGYLSVAELVARERSATAAYPWAQRDRRPRALTPAAELLRREGVRVNGVAPTEPLAAATPVHVAKLLRRETEMAAREDRKPNRAAAIGSAAVLCGLTVAGLIALKPATTDPNNLAAANGGGDGSGGQQAGALPSSDDVSPTTSVLKRADSKDTDKPANMNQAPEAPQTTDAPNNGGGGGAPAQPDAPSAPDSEKPAPPSDKPEPPPSEPTEPPSEPTTPPPNNGDGDDCDGLLDPVCDLVGGVLDPVKGSVSGTLTP